MASRQKPLSYEISKFFVYYLKSIIPRARWSGWMNVIDTCGISKYKFSFSNLCCLAPEISVTKNFKLTIGLLNKKSGS